MSELVFADRHALAAYARQRLRFPDPAPGARQRAIEDIRAATVASMAAHPDAFDPPALASATGASARTGESA